MDNKDLLFLFAIAKEKKRSFENPVILLTMKDYAEDVFKTMVDLRALILENASTVRIADLINNFHLNWLQAVQDVENFKKRTKDTPREVIQIAIDFTIECMKRRYRNFKTYIEHVINSMPQTEAALLHTDAEIIDDMQEIITYSIIEKQKWLQCASDKSDFNMVILHEIEELLNWLDMLYNNLAIQFTKLIELNVPELPDLLSKTLQHIVDEVTRCSATDALSLVEDIQRSKSAGLLGRVRTSVNDLEINNIVNKIKLLENRISRMKTKTSSAGIMALEHKTIFLEERLESLQHLKVSLNFLKSQSKKSIGPERSDKSIENEIKIFNHLLPLKHRCHLVEKLAELWQNSLSNQDVQSFVSILSAAEVIEVFSDDLGKFTIDKHGRKMYKKEGVDNVYQVNERNELITVNDDEKNVYFYDECGRYYLNESNARVYKAHSAASEYSLHKSGFLVKVGEMEDGIDYRYDHLGRYYISGDGVRIYRDKDSSDDYRNDGLGNLVMIRDNDPIYETCPVESSYIDENEYLKKTIGTALKKCLAEVIMVQPSDPVKYLAERLEKYRNNMEARQKRLVEEQFMMAERERLLPKERVILTNVSSGETVSEEDYNFIHYVSNDIH